MLLLRKATLPEGKDWIYELKFDGYRAVAFKTDGDVHLRSRNDKNFNLKYPAIVDALSKLPNETVLDGELVVLDETGRQSFNALQLAGSRKAAVYYFIFDVMILAGQDLHSETLQRRRHLLQKKILPRLSDPIRFSPELEGTAQDLLAAARTQQMEGIVAKRRESFYEPGVRSGAWQKVRTNQGQEFVIGGYTVAVGTFDALILGYFDGPQLIYVGRTRSGFTPKTRADLFRKFKKLARATCPFANLPESRSGRWGQGLTEAKMADCRWIKPLLVGNSSSQNGLRTTISVTRSL
jgi:bifunctional non-homologous end joining protein LigD